MARGAMLEVRGLRTEFALKNGVVRAVNDVSLSLEPRSVLGIVGESGSGKSATALSIVALITYPGTIVGGEVLYQGQDLLQMSEGRLQPIRGKEIAMVFQDATASLNPILTIGDQIEEVLIAHLHLEKSEARRRVIEVLNEVGIPEPREVLSQYSFQLSGGMRQRVVLAIAMVMKPKIIIADEPTSGVDLTTQAEILDQLQRLKDESGTSFILISHDLGVIARMADRIAVMYGGYIVERGEAGAVLSRPIHPYTWSLLRSEPRLDRLETVLPSLPGAPPDLLNLGEECPFLPRCNKALSVCRVKPMPDLVELEPDHFVACYNPIRHD